MTNRISLNIALKYLNHFRQNEGNITNIMFSIRSNVSSNVITETPFEDIEMLTEYIERYTKPSKRDLGCSPLLLFELKKFTIFKNNTNKNLVYNDNGSFITKSSNINSLSTLAINEGYFTDIEEVKDVYNKLNLAEYIKNQVNYIECGYLEGYKINDLDQLKKLYNKYNQ